MAQYKSRGRAKLEKQEILNRIKWKNLLNKVEKRVAGNNPLSSTKYAENLEKHYIEYFNEVKVPIKKGFFNHYRRISSQSEENNDLSAENFRVPPIEQIALSMVWTLEDINAWKTIESNEANKEKEDLLGLLKFKYVPREKYIKKSPVLRNVIDLLHAAVKQATGLNEDQRIVIEIHSAIGFHINSSNAQDFKVAIKECLKNGKIYFIYFLQELFENEASEWHACLDSDGKIDSREKIDAFQRHIKPKLFSEVLANLYSAYFQLTEDLITQDDKGFSQKNDIRKNIFVGRSIKREIPHFQDAFTRVALLKKVSGIHEDNIANLLKPEKDDFIAGIVEFVKYKNSQEQYIADSSLEEISEGGCLLYKRIQENRKISKESVKNLFEDAIVTHFSMPAELRTAEKLDEIFFPKNGVSQEPT